MRASTISATAPQPRSPEQTSTTRQCPRCGASMAPPAAQARHLRDGCPTCRTKEKDRVAQQAQRARRKDPEAVGLMREIIKHHEGGTVSVEDVLPLARRFGRDREYVDNLLYGLADCDWIVIGSGSAVIGSGSAVIGSGSAVIGSGDQPAVDPGQYAEAHARVEAPFQAELRDCFGVYGAGRPAPLLGRPGVQRGASSPPLEYRPWSGSSAAVRTIEVERMADAALANLDPRARAAMTLITLNLTAPKGTAHEQFREYVLTFAELLGACDGVGGALVLAIGRNEPGGKPHAHGPALTTLGSDRALDLWCSVSGATRRAHPTPWASRILTGWPAYVSTGDPDHPGTTKEGKPGRHQDRLRRNLRSNLVYALVNNIVDDLDRDVIGYGALGEAVKASAHAMGYLDRDVFDRDVFDRDVFAAGTDAPVCTDVGTAVRASRDEVPVTGEMGESMPDEPLDPGPPHSDGVAADAGDDRVPPADDPTAATDEPATSSTATTGCHMHGGRAPFSPRDAGVPPCPNFRELGGGAPMRAVLPKGAQPLYGLWLSADRAARSANTLAEARAAVAAILVPGAWEAAEETARAAMTAALSDATPIGS